MKAYEANRKTSEKEYEQIITSIEEAIKDAKAIAVFTGPGFTQETINKLIDDGYDVTIICIIEDDLYETRVSWMHAMATRKGTLIRESKEDRMKKLANSSPLLAMMMSDKPCDIDPDFEKELDEFADDVAEIFGAAMGDFNMDDESNGGEENPEAEDNTCSCGDNEGTCQCDGNCNCGDHCICDKPDDDPDFPVDGRGMP